MSSETINLSKYQKIIVYSSTILLTVIFHFLIKMYPVQYISKTTEDTYLKHLNEISTHHLKQVKKQQDIGVLLCTIFTQYAFSPQMKKEVQSLLWFLFSLLCLIYYYKGVPNTSQATTFTDAVYLRFLDSTFFSINQFPGSILLDPAAFSAFNWIYVVLDACLLIFALFQLHEMITSSTKLRQTMKRLTFNLLTICILDFFFVIGLGIDYGKTCVEPGSAINKNMCQNGVLPVLVFAAKGFVFWFVNCSLVFILRRIAKSLPLDLDSSAVDSTTPTCNEGHGVVDSTRLAYSGGHQAYGVNDDLYDSRGPQFEFEFVPTTRMVSASRYNAMTGQMEYYPTTESSYEYRYVRKY